MQRSYIPTRHAAFAALLPRPSTAARRLSAGRPAAGGLGKQLSLLDADANSWQQRALPAASAAGLLVAGVALGWRWARREMAEPAVHRDGSIVAMSAEPLVVVVGDGSEQIRFTCRPAQLQAARAAVLDDLAAARETFLAESKKSLSFELAAAFEPAQGRIARFADWYFRYTTTYKLMLRAIDAAGRHARNFGSDERLADAVQRELEEHICDRFLRIVLQPEATDSACRAAFSKTLYANRATFRTTVNAILRARLQEVCIPAPPTVQVPDGRPEVTLDWRAQAFKAQGVAATYDKNPEWSLALVAAGLLTGKAVGTKGAAFLAGKAFGPPLTSKLASPFALKIIGALAPGTAGLGGAVAGPVGALAGAATGLVADVLLNEAVELLQRDSFECDTRQVILATSTEWEALFVRELEFALDAWVSDVDRVMSDWVQSQRSEI